MNSKDYIKEKLQVHIDKYVKQQNCEHDFEQLGFGFNCKKCDYYTGLNHELNNIIEKELNRVKKIERITDENIR